MVQITVFLLILAYGVLNYSDTQLFNKSTPTNNVVYSLHYNITYVSANMNKLKMNYKVMSECQ
jgi:hypothetical protein